MDKMSVIRTVILIIALVNQVLTLTGHSPLPISDETVNSFIGTAFTIIASLWTWWKNNYIGQRGKDQKDVLQRHGLYRP